MKTRELIDFEEMIKTESDIKRLLNFAMIVFDQTRLAEIKQEAEKIEERMFSGDRADYCFDVPALSDEEVFFAADVLKGRLRVLGESVPEEDEEPKEI